MLRYFISAVILVNLINAFPSVDQKQISQPQPTAATENAEPKTGVPKSKQLVHPLDQGGFNPQIFLRQFPSQQQQQGGQYGLGILEAQYQFPGAFPRVQPQIVLYGPGGQGQPILFNPGSPPGNFLVPQGGNPNVLISDTPQRPVFLAGYPKPAHIPPIEKDAEEIPTNPEKIPPLPSGNPAATKPEKLESSNSDDKTTPLRPTPNNVNPELFSQHPKVHPSTLNPQPGQRFFILNGDQVITGYTGIEPVTENIFQRYNPQPFPTFVPNGEHFFRKQTQNPERTESEQELVRNDENSQPNLEETNSDAFFKSHNVLPEEIGQFKFTPPFGGNIFAFQDDANNEAIIVEADLDQFRGTKLEEDNTDSEVVTTSPTQAEPAGPSVAQAGPGGIALAGPGGVAGTAPRGTAIVGKGGLAVASPQATAVAGPREEDKKEKNVKNDRNNKGGNKKTRSE